jgi:two-component system, NtrC family, response regulator AtoC
MIAAEPLVLVVDDDPRARRMLDVRLRALGCRVEMAANGREALAAIKRDLPAVMLIDLQMPEMDGMAVLHRLKHDRIEIATIVITAYGSSTTAADAQQAGALGFFEKPYDGRELELVVRRILEHRQFRCVDH